MARKIITGDAEIEAMLTALSDKAADRVARSALSGAITEYGKAMRRAAPDGIKGSIKGRFSRGKGNVGPSAKAGVHVKRKRRSRQQKQQEAAQSIQQGLASGYAPHAHLVTLGTDQRHRETIGGKFSYISEPSESQLSTGIMPANPYLKQAAEAATGAAQAKMRKRAEKALDREVAKLKKG